MRAVILYKVKANNNKINNTQVIYKVILLSYNQLIFSENIFFFFIFILCELKILVTFYFIKIYIFIIFYTYYLGFILFFKQQPIFLTSYSDDEYFSKNVDVLMYILINKVNYLLTFNI